MMLSRAMQKRKVRLPHRMVLQLGTCSHHICHKLAGAELLRGLEPRSSLQSSLPYAGSKVAWSSMIALEPRRTPWSRVEWAMQLNKCWHGPHCCICHPAPQVAIQACPPGCIATSRDTSPAEHSLASVEHAKPVCGLLGQCCRSAEAARWFTSMAGVVIVGGELLAEGTLLQKRCLGVDQHKKGNHACHPDRPCAAPKA